MTRRNVLARVANATAAATAGAPWQMPVDAAAFYQGPLTPGDREDLARAVELLDKAAARPFGEHLATMRVAQPLLALAAVYPHARKGVPDVIRAMHRLGANLWAFREQDWVDTYNGVNGRARRNMAVLASYVLCGVSLPEHRGRVTASYLASVVFGREALDANTNRTIDVLAKAGYSVGDGPRESTQRTWAMIMLAQRSPRMEDVTIEHLAALRDDLASKKGTVSTNFRNTSGRILAISRALKHLGIVEAPLRPYSETAGGGAQARESALEGVPAEWRGWVERWFEACTMESRDHVRSRLMQIGRWLAAERPENIRPDTWNTDTVIALRAALDHTWTSGKWAAAGRPVKERGKPIGAGTKIAVFSACVAFFKDLKRYKWVRDLDLDVGTDFVLPRPWINATKANPRDVSETIWLKLIYASLNLTDEDIREATGEASWYPPNMIRAMAILWTHGGLRSDEYARLEVGCVRDVSPGATPEDAELATKTAYLSVPVSKTAGGRPHPISKLVANAIRRWEAERLPQLPVKDRKTRLMVHRLFSTKSHPVNKGYWNRIIIPMLCAKAGVPQEDVPGRRITSHRGRASVATLLYNSREGMTLEELQDFLGHKFIGSTSRYVRASPRKQARTYARATKDMHLQTVLVDHAAVVSGAAARGEAYQFYPLADGSYCSNPAWARCDHRMACAGCGHNVPADSVKGTALRARDQIGEFLVAMPLTDEEREVADGDLAALSRLIDKLKDVPTPTGETPTTLKELNGDSPAEKVVKRGQLPVLGVWLKKDA